MPENETKARKGRKLIRALISILFILIGAAAVIYFGVYRDVCLYMNVELGEPLPPASAFMRDGSAAEYLDAPDAPYTEEGGRMLTLKTDNFTRKVFVIVKDTQPPQTSSADKIITVDVKSMTPEEALTPISDASSFTAEWVKQPQFGRAGVYDCSVLLRDAVGNETIVYPKVTVIGTVQELTVEAGSEPPTLADFMVVEREDARLLTDLDSINWSTPSEHDIAISFGGVTYTSKLIIVDTAAPVPDLIAAAVEKGGSFKAEDFIIGCKDATEVTYALISKPDTSRIGTAAVELRATDEAGNSAEVEGRLLVCDKVIELEASNETLTQELLLSKLGDEYRGYAMGGEGFTMNGVGAHGVTVRNTDGGSAVIGIVIKDTVAPKAKGIDCPCSTGYPCDAMKFLTDIDDVSEVSASFVKAPDWSVEGEQEVEVKLTDRSGNSTVITAKAVISPDTEAPVIYAARDRYLYVGEAVAYFKEVFAQDNADPVVTLTVDKSKVDAKTPGTYDVTYTASDHEGNSSSVTVKFTFINKTVTDEKLDAEVNGVLSRILKDGMTVEEQAYAIFDYVYSNVTYWEGSDKTDWKAEAYRGLTSGVGDCFTFYSTTYALLSKIDCQVLSVERLNGRTQHFWCLVNLGTGWYHFDACNVGPEHLRCFMKTSEELVKYSEQYWRFDTTLYPALETRPYVWQS